MQRIWYDVFIFYLVDLFICSEIGFGNQSKFDVKVQRRERLLRKGIVSYIGGASEFTGKSIDSRIDSNVDCISVCLEPEIALVLSPITIMPRHQDRTSHFAGKETWSMTPLDFLIDFIGFSNCTYRWGCSRSIRGPLQ